MSRPYRILIQDIIKEQVEAADYSTLHLELLPILPDKQMKLLLSETLEEDGWEKTEEGYTYSPNENETISINLNTLEIKVELELSATVIKKISAQIDIDDWDSKKHQIKDEAVIKEEIELNRKKLEKTLKTEKQIDEAILQKRKKELEEKIRKSFINENEERKEKINKIVLKVYARALKEKAKKLGTIKEIKEDWKNDNEYQLTLRISE